MRSGGRVVEGARLESVYTATPYRGFESLPLRHLPRPGLAIAATCGALPNESGPASELSARAAIRSSQGTRPATSNIRYAVGPASRRRQRRRLRAAALCAIMLEHRAFNLAHIQLL